MISKNTARALAVGAFAAAVLALAPQARADEPPAAPQAPADASITAAQEAVAAPTTLDTLSRFFARDGAIRRAAADPRIVGKTVPVYYLNPAFVAGKPGVPIARLEFIAGKAVASDGQKASVWAARTGDTWRVVNIATGDDETRYAAQGARKLRGGTVFREPQIDAWYVQRGGRILPLDADATRAIGARGTSVDAYRKRVHQAYGDKLPGSAYARAGKAGGYGKDAPQAPAGHPPMNQLADGERDSGALPITGAAAGAVAVIAGALGLRRRLRRTQ
ncbi:hypothetical protein [Streptomyces sp. KR80]|uniref:hypothetical protein n=1 Tax=Streptomyces sp. KR80 TaxID=3457426 RepID=UPI003FD02950